MLFLIIKIISLSVVLVAATAFLIAWLMHIGMSATSFHKYGFAKYSKFYDEYQKYDWYIDKWNNMKSKDMKSKLESDQIVFDGKCIIMETPYDYARYLFFIYGIKIDWKKANRVKW